MKDERFQQLKNIIPKKEDSRRNISALVDGRYNEAVQYVKADLKRDSQEAENLRKKGYVLIYPKIVDSPIDGKEVNEYLNKNDAMIFDKASENPNVYTIHSIAMHYNKEGIDHKAIKGEDGSLTFAADDGLKKIYDEIGIEYEEKENGDITVRSDIKMKEIQKSKMAQIYDKAKGKVKGAFNNLKNFFKGKEQDRALGQGMQEQESNER